MATFAVALRICGDDLEPDEITTALGSAPSDSYRKGDPISPGRSDAFRKWGMWILEAPDAEPEAFDMQVDHLLSTLTQDFAVWRSLVQRYEVDLYCGFFMDTTNQGFALALQTLSALVDRGIELGFDVYAPTPEEHSEYRAKQEVTVGKEPE